MTQFMRICFEFFVLYWVWEEMGPVSIMALVLLILACELLSYRLDLVIRLLNENGMSIDQMRLTDHFRKHKT